MSPLRNYLSVTFLFVLLLPVGAAVRLPGIISDHMVLQAEVEAVPLWGWADPGERVTVTFAGHRVETVTRTDGAWRVDLPRLSATAEGRDLIIAGKDQRLVRDVVVGEVWLCSGQSNMEMQMKGLHGQVDRADEEIAAAQFPALRLFDFDEAYDIYRLPVPPGTPQADRPGRWIRCTPETAARFIALGYYFGRELHQVLHGRAVGLVHSSVGGTPIEAWTSLEAQKAVTALQPLLADWTRRLDGYDPAREQSAAAVAREAWIRQRDAAKAAHQPPPKAPAAYKNLRVSTPAGLFNGMIAPLVPYRLKGVLWYQGERNAAGPFTSLYGLQLETLVKDWRSQWGDDLYFAWVQIPAFQREQREPSEPNGWGVWVRDGQRQALRLPRTGMAITLDLGGATAGHPTNKADFAHRLALVVRHEVYGEALPFWSGPVFRSARQEPGQMVLTFDHAEGLKSSQAELKGFAIADAQRKFVWARARIQGNEVIVSHPDLARPTAVRYGWAANPVATLVNGGGLPASPFATDDGR
ncbi:MAG: hypothetical protein JNN01_10165 [Opitutaceae bacterium]|nr:hypothetical protein [Opitutaceae bacterium]